MFISRVADCRECYSAPKSRRKRANEDVELTTKYDVSQVVKSRTIRELDAFLFDELHQRHCIVGRFSFSVSRHTEDDEGIFGNLVEVIEIVTTRSTREHSENACIQERIDNVLFRIAYEGRESISRFCLFGDSRSVIFGSSSLRSVKDDDLFLLCTQNRGRVSDLSM